MQTLSYPAHEVYAHDRDLFLRSLFVPAGQREPLLVLYALIVELEKIPGIVSEEMIGHIRYAWWQESIEALYTGKVPHGQPVLEALLPLITSGQLPPSALLPMVEQYRSHFPAPPPERDAMIKTLSLALLQYPTIQKAWCKADRILTIHRKRYGRRLHTWLMVKLLILSFG